MDWTGILLFAGIIVSALCVFVAKYFFPNDSALFMTMSLLLSSFTAAFFKHLPGSDGSVVVQEPPEPAKLKLRAGEVPGPGVTSPGAR